MTMTPQLPLLLFDVIPLPGEVVSLPYATLKDSLPEKMIKNHQSFGVYYSHFMNVYNVAVKVRVVATTRDHDTDKSIWVRGEKIFMIQNIVKSSDGETTLCDVRYMRDMYRGQMSSSAQRDIEQYAKNVARVAPLRESLPEDYGTFDVLRIMALSDVEKFYALSMPTVSDRYVYVVNAVRMRLVDMAQSDSIDTPFFLN